MLGKKLIRNIAFYILDLFNIAIVKHHYYTPVVFPRDIKRPLDSPRTLPGLDFNVSGQLDLLRKFNYTEELQSIPLEKGDAYSAAYRNASFEAGDAEILYNMIRHFKPKRIVEIGCG